MENKEVAINFLKDKQNKLVKNFQTDIFSIENTGEYKKYQTDENYFKALALSKGIDEVLKELERLEKQDNVIKECIKLLSQDGNNTKQKVKEKLEELVKRESNAFEELIAEDEQSIGIF